MMTWNYRVFREENGDYVIREVFYAEDGAVLTCTADAVEPFGESLEGLAQDLAWFQEALVLPVLTLADIPTTSATSTHYDRNNAIPLEQLLAEFDAEEHEHMVESSSGEPQSRS